MSERPRLFQPGPEDPPLEDQVLAVCLQAIQEAGGYIVPHPEEHSVVVVFHGHQTVVTVRPHTHGV